MKKTRNWLTPLLLALLLLAYTVCMSACRSPERDERNLSDTEYAVNSVAAVDALGRVTIAADSETDRDVGLFYFLWLGSHASGVYDVSKLEEESPEELFDPTSKVSPQGAYHFWGEPLYGYYNSEDEWVITRHVELFTMAGIDFLMFDTTNAVIYERVVSKVLQVLDKYQKQGWDVPKIGFLTNSNTKGTVTAIYNTFYTEGKDDYYPDLWYSPNGKPLITSNTMYYDETVPEDKKLLDFFEIRDIQWPDSPYYEDDAFTWMDWNYKQHNHNGQMSVSVAQHTSGKMSNQSDNCGRGYNFSTFQNEADGVLSGSNFEAQWQTAIENKEVKTAFITGWNEWIALKKYEYGECFFVDLYNMEYSRDVEMMKGGYGDNFYLQMLRNVRAFKYTDAKEYELPVTDMSRADAWDSVQKYPDFVGDAMERNFRAYHGSLPDYVDTTNRNDIVNVQVAHDADNLYFRVETLDDVTEYQQGDNGWMNIRLATSKNGDFNYVVNHTYGKLSRISGDSYSVVGDVEVKTEGKFMTVKIPLSLIGQSGTPAVRFKVSDNVDASDVMNFYIQGDSAPIGRLSYTYGYQK